MKIAKRLTKSETCSDPESWSELKIMTQEADLNSYSFSIHYENSHYENSKADQIRNLFRPRELIWIENNGPGGWSEFLFFLNSHYSHYENSKEADQIRNLFRPRELIWIENNGPGGWSEFLFFPSSHYENSKATKSACSDPGSWSELKIMAQEADLNSYYFSIHTMKNSKATKSETCSDPESWSELKIMAQEADLNSYSFSIHTMKIAKRFTLWK